MEYFVAVRSSIQRKDGFQLSLLLSHIHPSFPPLTFALRSHWARLVNPYYEYLQREIPLVQNIKDICEKTLPNLESYDETVYLYLSIFNERNPIERYKQHCNLYQSFQRSFSSSDNNWEIPVLKLLSMHLYAFAIQADACNSTNGSTSVEFMEDAARILSKSFSTCMTDRVQLSLSKKWGAIYIVTLLFKIYFKLNNLNLCNSMLKALENPKVEFPDLSFFPKSEQVTYKFLRGRISMHQNDFKKAEELLEYSFVHCYKLNFKNKRIILTYLLILKMMHGRLPTNELLIKYNLEDRFLPLALSLKTGNVLLFNKALLRNNTFYIQMELYLYIIIQLKNLLYRGLFKKVYTIVSKNIEIDFRLSIKYLEAALNYLEVNVSIDEVECIVANMIYSKFIRGYISHDKRILVLSKKSPFPPLVSFL